MDCSLLHVPIGYSGRNGGVITQPLAGIFVMALGGLFGVLYLFSVLNYKRSLKGENILRVDDTGFNYPKGDKMERLDFDEISDYWQKSSEEEKSLTIFRKSKKNVEIDSENFENLQKYSEFCQLFFAGKNKFAPQE